MPVCMSARQMGWTTGETGGQCAWRSMVNNLPRQAVPVASPPAPVCAVNNMRPDLCEQRCQWSAGALEWETAC